jgi:hypothetical protein
VTNVTYLFIVITEVARLLKFFSNDQLKLHALLFSISSNLSFDSIGKKSNNLQFHELAKLPSDWKYKITLLLIDVTFELLISPPESLFLEGSVIQRLMAEPDPGKIPASSDELGKQPSTIRVSELIRERLFTRFQESDIILFGRILFLNHMWERFSVLAQVFEAQISVMREEGMTIEPANSLRSANSKSEEYINEFALRISVINFHNVVHAERKVNSDFFSYY